MTPKRYNNRYTPRPLRERLLSRLVPDAETGCLLWTGSIRRNDGYGQVRADGRMRLVHRVMWEMFEGPIPDGLQLDHVRARGCVNKHCASIAHLEPVTPRENMLRGPTIVSVLAARTHCPAGHEYDLPNTYITRSGGRSCRACHREDARRRRQQAAI